MEGAYYMNLPLYLFVEICFCLKKFGKKKEFLFQITQQASSSAHIRTSMPEGFFSCEVILVAVTPPLSPPQKKHHYLVLIPLAVAHFIDTVRLKGLRKFKI